MTPIPPIVLSGRAVSRAFLAVQQAAEHTDDDRPMLYRAVQIEVFDTHGVRLTATNSYWVAQCWVPERGEFGDNAPEFYEVADATVTVIDDEWRLRDLLRHVAKATKKAEAPDIDVVVDHEHRIVEPAQPCLDPSLEPRRCRVEIPGRERVNVRVWEGDWVNWRPIWQDFHRDEPTGTASRTSLGPGLFTDVCRSALIIDGTLDVSWCDDRRAVVRVNGTLPDLETLNLTALVLGLNLGDPDRPQVDDVDPLGPDDDPFNDGEIPGQQTIETARHLEAVPT